MQEHFSPEANQLIAGSRLVAIDLGYDYISTLHFLLADGQLNYRYSLRGFCFTDEQDFKTFYHSRRVGDASIFVDSLPITMEAERTIKLAHTLWRKKYPAENICPYHIFLAACQVEDAVFNQVLTPREGLFGRLENYYLQAGAITTAENRDQKGRSGLLNFFRKK